ncbi:MAG: FISUMP domain-containing protein [Candidatus Saccharibacteria bacterium]|nr:FISUMP domain-containing protein [Candidatus Saccharibacteria bacterium]
MAFSSFQILFPSVPSNAATEATATANLELEVEPTIEVAVDTQSLNLAYNGETDILPTSEGVTATGDINVYVTTNGISGYTLSLYSQSPTNEMTNINSAVTSKISPTAGGATLANNTWGYQYNGGNWTTVSDDAADPSVITNNGVTPGSLCPDLATNYQTCYPSSADRYTVTFGAKITDALPAGRYTNDVVFSAIAKSPTVQRSYQIAYNKNNSSATGDVANATALLPGNVPALSDGTGFTLEGMKVVGWALTEGATDVATVGGNAMEVGASNIDVAALISAAADAGQDVSEDKSGTITLYAIWGVAAKYMQDFSCSSLNVGDTDTLTDKRDGSEYNVKKFADNQCWMTSNLILGHDKGYALTKDDTNIPSSDTSTYYLPQAGYRGNLNSSSTTGSATFDGSNDSQAQVQYRAAGQSGDQSSSGTLFQSTGYYNFYAATLGCSYYQGGSSCLSGYVQKDICPKGWQLPTGDTGTKSWYYFYNTLNGASHANMVDSTKAALGYSGYYISSQLYGVGSYGYWWSSTVYDTSSSRYLYLDTSSVYPQNNYYKCIGFAVRCVAQ